jgi:two-component system cell cycle sensor histidine kinase/response regulator CckA
VRIDSGAFEQVLMNLAVNARDAMPEGGTLTIETSNVCLNDVFGAGHEIAFTPGEYVVLAVSDTGCGMDRETCARVFEPFFTTKDIGKGTGLGLSTCYGIVKQADGYIWVYSEPGLGTTFKVYLPRVLKATETAVTVDAPRQLGGNETILVAEDDALLRDLVSLVLKTRGYTVIEASNAEEAIEKSSLAGEIDLLLTDVVMPGLQGPQLGSKLRDAKPDLKIILMSGYAPAGAAQHEFPLLQKPFTPASLCEKVRQELDAEG